jgi:hypothetical protein
MSPLVRRVVAVLAAFASAAVIVMLFEGAGGRFFPAEGVDPTDREQLEAAVRAGAIPLGAYLMVAGGWIVGAFVGATVALKLGREGGRGATMIFAGLFTLACAANLVMMPHPAWMWFVGIVAVPLVAVAAGRDRSAG